MHIPCKASRSFSILKSPAKATISFPALLAAGLLVVAPGTANATGNTGSGGTITYTDSNGSNAVVSPPYVGGYVVHTFNSSGTLSVGSYSLVTGGGSGLTIGTNYLTTGSGTITFPTGFGTLTLSNIEAGLERSGGPIDTIKRRGD